MYLAAQKSYRVERVESEAELLALREDWTRLMSEVKDLPIFLTWEWITTWWRHWAAEEQPWVLAVRDRTEQLVGLAPWMLAISRFGPLHLRRIQFIGTGLVAPVHLGVLAPLDLEDVVCAAIASYLESHHRDWDVLDLSEVTRQSALPCCLKRRARPYRQTEGSRSPVILLPDSWEAYADAQLSRHHKQELRRRARLLERDAGAEITFEQVDRPEALAVAFERLVDLSRSRFHQRSLSTSFDNNRFVAFHSELAALALERGWLRMFLMRVGGCIIAIQHVFCYGGIYYDYQKALDPEWSKYAPGSLLMAHAVKTAIAEGARAFDLGSGAQDYKLDWTDQVREDYQFSLGNNWKGYVWMVSGALFDHARVFGKQVLPQPVQHRINQVASARRSG